MRFEIEISDYQAAMAIVLQIAHELDGEDTTVEQYVQCARELDFSVLRRYAIGVLESDGVGYETASYIDDYLPEDIITTVKGVLEQRGFFDETVR